MKFYMDENILYEIYELFYWKKFDIHNPNIVLEVHSMMRFLYRYDICLSNNGFSIDSTIEKFPFNEDVQVLVDNLKTMDQDMIKEVALSKEAIMKIQIASIELHSYAKEYNYEFSSFVSGISKIVHVTEQVLPQAQGNKITELDYIEENEETINSALELVKNIDKDIEKNLQKDKKAN